jgi:hypothetical protein
MKMSDLSSETQKSDPEKNPAIAELWRKKEIPGLIQLLKSHDPEIQSKAQRALVQLGDVSFDGLIAALRTKDRTLRMGVMGALSELKDPRAIPPLTGELTDPSSEVRWQAAIALGEIGIAEAIPPLKKALNDADKYVRYSSAMSLHNLGWVPGDIEENARYRVALQEWNQVVEIGKPAIQVLTDALRDKDHDVRINIIRTLGNIGNAGADTALIQAVGDPDREVRWEAVLASEKCGISPFCLPRALNRRPRTTKNPYIAGFLNFILPGLGYTYLGRWWGTMIFQIDITATVWLYKMQGDIFSYQVLFPIYLILAVHVWYITRKQPDDPP